MNETFRIKEYLNCMLQIPALSEAETELAVAAMATGDVWAHRLLEERFLPQVIRWVLPYRGLGPEFEALIEAGNRALLKGLRQLKPGLAVDTADFLEACVVQDVEAMVLPLNR
jgi:hypothetical protein